MLYLDLNARYFASNGIARWLEAFIPYLEQQGIQHQTIDLFHFISRERFNSAAKWQQKYWFLAYYNLWIPRLLKQQPGKLVVIDNIGGYFFCPSKHPCYFLVHDITLLEEDPRQHQQLFGWRAACYKRLHQPYFRWRLRRVLNAAAARVITISQDSANKLRQHILLTSTEIRAITGGFVLTELQQADTAQPEFTQPLQQLGSFILAVGNGEPKKGINDLLQALAALKQPQLHLVLFGNNWKGIGHSQLQQNIHALGLQGQVTHLGAIDNQQLAWLYRHCLAFVFPSYSEGLGLPPAEFRYLSTRPLILRDIPTFREFYNDQACFFTTNTELTDLLQQLADNHLVCPHNQTQLQRDFAPTQALSRLWHAIQDSE